MAGRCRNRAISGHSLEPLRLAQPDTRPFGQTPQAAARNCQARQATQGGLRSFVLTSAGRASQIRACLHAPLPRFGAAGVNCESGGRGAATPPKRFANKQASNKQDDAVALACLAAPLPPNAALLGGARSPRNRCGGKRRQRLRGVQLRPFPHGDLMTRRRGTCPFIDANCSRPAFAHRPR